jgi:hypothetical protein
MPSTPAVAVPTLAAQRRQVVRNDNLSVRADLNGQQTALELGQAIPLVIGKRTGSTGGVLISPPASECRFTNDIANRVTASYLLVLADGQLGTIAATDAYQGDTQLVSGEITQAYGARAASWAPGNFIQQRFEVTTTSRVETVEGKAIGAGAFFDLSSFGTDEELANHIDDQVATVDIKSSGNYITGFEVSVEKTINWPAVGNTKAYKGTPGEFSVSISSGGGGGGGGTTGTVIYNPATAAYYESLAWNASSDSSAGPSGSGNSPELLRYGSFGTMMWWVASNQWFIDRASAGRYLPTAQYQISRPPSTQPYGDIDYQIREVINGGFLLPITASALTVEGTYYATIYGGLPAVSYRVTVTEENSEPLPKPEATIYCGTGGTYAGLTTVSLSKTYAAGDTGWQRQAHFFIRNGQPIHRLIEGTPGATNLFPDVAHHLLIASGRMPSQLIDVPGLTAAARFCAVNGITFDGVIANPANVREYLSLMAPMHLLRVTDRWGLLGLRPALPVTIAHAVDTSPLTPVMVFDESNSSQFQITRRPIADRKPFAALVLWRDQPENDVGVTQATEVRYAGTAIDGPWTDLDGSEFITRELHAVRAGAFRLAQRRHITHDASWVVSDATPQLAALRAGDIVRQDRARNPSVGASSIWSYLYEIESISGPLLGPWTIQASHHPVDDNGCSIIAREVAAATVA